MRRAWIRRSVGTVLVAMAVGGGILGAGNVIGTGSGGSGGTGTAKIWVATAGTTNCTKSSTFDTYTVALSGNHVCTTPPLAYAQAACGDTVLMKGATYTARWYFTAASRKTCGTNTCNYGVGNLTDCVKFQPAPSETVNLQVAPPFANSSQVLVCAAYVAIYDVHILDSTFTNAGGFTETNSSVTTGSGDSTCGTTAPHDILLDNLDYGGSGRASGGSYNVWFVGGTAVDMKEAPWQMGGHGNNGLITAGTHDSGIEGVVFQGYNFTRAATSTIHLECIHMDFQGDSNTIRGNVFETCPVFGIRVEAEGTGGYQTNHVIEANFFDSGAPSGQVNFDCHDNGCAVTGNKVRFNSFNGTGFAPTNDCAQIVSQTCTDSSNVFYGNLGGGCPSAALIQGLGWTTSYNVSTGAQGGICTGDSTSSYSQTVTYVSAGTPNYDLHLSGAQTAVAFAPCASTPGCPVNDYDGVAFPATANAGADQP